MESRCNYLSPTLRKSREELVFSLPTVLYIIQLCYVAAIIPALCAVPFPQGGQNHHHRQTIAKAVSNPQRKKGHIIGTALLPPTYKQLPYCLTIDFSY